jgi:hypothetical protein
MQCSLPKNEHHYMSNEASHTDKAQDKPDLFANLPACRCYQSSDEVCDTKLSHHAQIISYCPVFDGFAISEAHEMHVVLLKGSTGGSYALERTQMGSAHGHSASDGVSFGHQFLNRKMQVGKGCPQHPGDLPRRVGATTVHAGGNVVIEKVWRDELVNQVEVALVEHLLKGTAILGLVCFC